MNYLKERCTPEIAQLHVLTEIHNRLAEISKFLEVSLSLYAKLTDDEIEYIRDNHTQYMDITGQNNQSVFDDGKVLVNAPFPEKFGEGTNEFLKGEKI